MGKDPASLPPPSAGLCPCCPGEQTNAREETGWDARGSDKRDYPELWLCVIMSAGLRTG